jgi:hypothetical protein
VAVAHEEPPNMTKWNPIGWAAVAAVSLSTLGASPGAARAAGDDERQQQQQQHQLFRPPAVPLVTSDPYLSIWSEADHLNDDVTRHWTRRPHALVALIRIDGKTFRLMGSEPKDVPAFPQKSVEVLPTRSIYDFDDGHVHVTMSFTTPTLPDNLEALARPLTYISWNVRSADGAQHAVSLYDSTSSELAVNTLDQKVEWARETMGDLTALRVGTQEQTLLVPAGDDTRIDWGYAYAVANTAQTKSAVGANDAMETAFVENGTIPTADDPHMPRTPRDDQPVLAFTFDLGNVGAEGIERHMMVGYDEIWSINYYGKKLRPYWRRNGATPSDLFQAAERDYPALLRDCIAFDRGLMQDLTTVGGGRYAQIASLSYRQCLAACGLVADTNGQPLLFTKENTSNGDVATVDVFFPMDPIFVALSPTLAKASLAPVLAYAASEHWKFPNAPHDLGTYPIVMGRDDGGEGMPVEESGNMLILCDAIAKDDGNGDFVTPWWPQLTQWAKYLEQYGLDPENQLCTDDFMGHLAHNANLSVKAILGLAAYGDLCHRRGDEANAKRYMDLARADAKHWIKAAGEGDHYKLAFDKANTWSQKYNLVWDKLLGLNVFPPEVARTEVNYYKKMMQRYGVPLDSRTKLTKTDWSVWSATLADNQADFETIVSPIWDYLNQTTVRDPVSDSYITNNIKSGGMHARPVVGGIFIKMLDDANIWKKWAGRDHMKVGNFAPVPPAPELKPVVPTGQHAKVMWKYTLEKPAAGWEQAGFNDSAWKQGAGGFGSRGTPAIAIGTPWTTDDIWLRRAFTMPEGDFANLQLDVFHDEGVQIFLNGALAARARGFITSYEPIEISRTAKEMLKPGAKVVMAVHCHQTKGGQGVDVGLVNVIER